MRYSSSSIIFVCSTLLAFLIDILYPFYRSDYNLNSRISRYYYSKFYYNDEYFFLQSKSVSSKYEKIRNSSSYSRLKYSTNTYERNLLNREDFKNRYTEGDLQGNYQKQNATILMLARNWELPGVLSSMRSLEDRFNREYHYDWVFLNDVPFVEDFIEATTAMASGNVYHGLVPSEQWDCPSDIDQTKLNETLALLQEQGVVYGGSLSYRNMCRFNSGFFFRHELLNNYDYYFRVEPNVEYFCDFPYDPFKIMHDKDYKYGFVISTLEYEDTIPTLWEATEEYIELYEDTFNIDNNKNLYNFITDHQSYGPNNLIVNTATDYNLCHFWSNFEIGNLDFFRSEAYLKYFELLDSKQGFYYERWGDAPVHTIAASILLNKDEIIHFDEIGYEHKPLSTCPTSYYLRINQRCQCNIETEQNIDIKPNSCLSKFWKHGMGKKFLKE